MAIKYKEGVYVKEHERNEAFKLPVKLVQEIDEIADARAKLHSLMKKQIANVLNNHPEQFDKDLTDFLTQFKEKWYSKGLKAMDKMHSKINLIGQ